MESITMIPEYDKFVLPNINIGNPFTVVLKKLKNKIFEVVYPICNIVYNFVDFLHFLSIVKVSNSYYNFPEHLQEAGVVVGLISYMVFDGRVKSVFLRVGDDGYPEVRVVPSYKVSSKELRDKLKEISKIKWELSNDCDGLLWVSVIINR